MDGADHPQVSYTFVQIRPHPENWQNREIARTNSNKGFEQTITAALDQKQSFSNRNLQILRKFSTQYKAPELTNRPGLPLALG
jgi:hypothetical protein